MYKKKYKHRHHADYKVLFAGAEFESLGEEEEEKPIKWWCREGANRLITVACRLAFTRLGWYSGTKPEGARSGPCERVDALRHSRL